jgi:lipoyl(octanoyl) transferase
MPSRIGGPGQPGRRRGLPSSIFMDLWTVHLGVVEYREAWALQERVRAARQADAIPDTLLLLEHPPVYTRGRRSQPGELGLGEDWYRAQGIDIVDVDRGGLLTYHGPGQLVGYPIMRVQDLTSYIGTMEEAIAATLAEEGLAGARGRSREGREVIGVWVEERKIASIGVHRSREVTTHGFAINLDNDLRPFEWVVACGLPDVQMTSLARELGDGPHLPCFRKRMAYRFAQTFGRRQRLVSQARLEAATAVGEMAEVL